MFTLALPSALQRGFNYSDIFMAGSCLRLPTPISTVALRSPVLCEPGDCHHLGEIRPQTKDFGSVPRNASGRHPGEGVPSGLQDH